MAPDSVPDVTVHGATRQTEITVKPHWATIPVVLTGVFMATLDFFIVNVAIPSTQHDLHATGAEVQWLVAGFGLAYGAGLITGGRLGDLYGRRRLFGLGLALFTLTSAACGLAPTATFLALSRVLQGASAALFAPQVLAILGTAYAGPGRARAFHLYGFTMGVAAVIGQLVGGLLIDANPWSLGWRSCFLINLPIGAAALLLTPRVVPASRAAGRPRLDAAGVALVTLALVALALPLIEGRQQGWPPWTWLSLATAIASLLGFAAHQRQLGVGGAAPLIDLALFRERAFTVGLLAQFVFFMGQAAFFFVLALYLQEGRGVSPLQAGEVFVAIGAGYLGTSISAGWAARRLGRQVIALGALIRAAGLALLLVTIRATPSVGLLAPGLAVVGAGSGLALGPLAATVLARVPATHAGAASGVLTTALQVGNALGVAIIGVIFYGALGHAGPLQIAYLHAFAGSLLYLITAGAMLALLVQLLPAGGA
jgi:EmrB/QacA subfamily drug resistance transporter